MKREHDSNPFCGPFQVMGGRLFQRRGMVIRDLGPAPVFFPEETADATAPPAPIDLARARFLRELRRDLETR